MKRFPLLALFAALACAPALTPVDQTAHEAWFEFSQGLPEDPPRALAAVEAYAADPGIPFSFWVDSTVDTTRFAIGDAPCGAVTEATVGRLFLGDRSGLSIEYAVEVDSAGRELMRWPLPMDAPVAAVRGSTIYVPLPARDGPPIVDIAIEPSGRYRFVESPARGKEESFDCPAVEAFKGSDYTACYYLKDLSTGTKRRLVWQSPCT